MMKSLLLLVSAVLIAAPAQARDESALRRQGIKLLSASLDAAKAKNFTTACTKYKEYIKFETTNGLNQFKKVERIPKVQRLIIKQNGLIAQANKNVNNSGAYLCGQANMPWTTVNLPTTYNSPTSTTNQSVGRTIRLQCEEKWDTDFRMVRYCIDKQTEAAQSLGY